MGYIFILLFPLPCYPSAIFIPLQNPKISVKRNNDASEQPAKVTEIILRCSTSNRNSDFRKILIFKINLVGVCWLSSLTYLCVQKLNP